MNILGKKYKAIPTTSARPCEQCCFSREECLKIIDTEGFMPCGCEFGGNFYCILIK